jgi:hypothetical protein
MIRGREFAGRRKESAKKGESGKEEDGNLTLPEEERVVFPKTL